MCFVSAVPQLGGAISLNNFGFTIGGLFVATRLSAVATQRPRTAPAHDPFTASCERAGTTHVTKSL
jgi:hypothetical protein